MSALRPGKLAVTSAAGGPQKPNGCGQNTTINSLAGLAALATVGMITTGDFVTFVNTTDSPASTSVPLAQTWQLVASTTATGNGRQRPNDYDASTNARVWFQVGG